MPMSTEHSSDEFADKGSAKSAKAAPKRASRARGAEADEDRAPAAGPLACLHPFPWQHEPWARMVAMRNANKMTHAWLMLGGNGIGRRGFVAAWAASLLCPNTGAPPVAAEPDMFGEVPVVAPRLDGSACGECHSCKAILAGGHPDAHYLGLDGHQGLAATIGLQRDDSIVHWEPTKESRRREIGVEGVRSLIEKLYVSSHSSGLKIAVVAPAELLNEASANALLKLIEEPPAGTILILVAEQLADLKPTLISRCQRLILPQPTAEQASAWLAEALPEQSATARAQALEVARDAPLRAYALLNADGLEKVASWQRVIADLTNGRIDPIQAAGAIGKTDPDGFLSWWIECLAGLLRQKSLGADAGNARFLSASVPAGLKLAALDRAVQTGFDARRGLDRNANPLLTLESLLIDWRGAIASVGAGK